MQLKPVHWIGVFFLCVLGFYYSFQAGIKAGEKELDRAVQVNKMIDGIQESCASKAINLVAVTLNRYENTGKILYDVFPDSLSYEFKIHEGDYVLTSLHGALLDSGTFNHALRQSSDIPCLIDHSRLIRRGS